MASVFSKIIAGEIPSYKIAESEHCFAFLDIRPLQKGHTLVIPKKEVDYIFDVDDELLTELILYSKHIAKAIKQVVSCDRIGVSIIGLEVPHAHIHLVPIINIGDMNFGRPLAPQSPEEFQILANKIKQFI